MRSQLTQLTLSWSLSLTQSETSLVEPGCSWRLCAPLEHVSVHSDRHVSLHDFVRSNGQVYMVTGKRV